MQRYEIIFNYSKNHGLIYYLCKMKQKSAHTRLHAFFYSYFLNICEVVLLTSLLWIDAFMDSILLAAIGILSLIIFICGVLHFWIKRPDRVVLNYRFANQTTYLWIYVSIITLTTPVNIWWYIAPTFYSLYILTAASIKNKDRTVYVISGR